MRIGVVGYGAMGKAHAYGYTAAPVIRSRGVRPRLTVLSGRNGAAVSAAARAPRLRGRTTDWRELVTSPDVDMVDICTPPGTHAEIIQAAAAAGKAVICEKPLAVRLADAEAAVAAVSRSNVLAAIGFNYRYLPAVALMRELIAAGEIGEVLLWRGTWLSDEFLDPAIPFDWRFDSELGAARSPTSAVISSTWPSGWSGRWHEVCAQSSTFTHSAGLARMGRPTCRHGRRVERAAAVRRRGAAGVLEVASTCARRPCDFTVEVNGTRGTLIFSYARLNELQLGR